MRNRLLVFIVSLMILALIACGVYESFEVYPKQERLPPSREARRNTYLALERWLEKTGHPVRVLTDEPAAVPSAAGEAVCVAEASRIDWKQTRGLFSWIEGGASLVLSLDRDSGGSKELAAFLALLGVRRTAQSRTPRPASGNSRPPGDSPEVFPDFDSSVGLKPVKENPKRKAMVCRRDSGGTIRLITVSLGKGSVTVCGFPRFMMWRVLQEDKNSALAWELTGARDPANAGVLFIRAGRVQENFYSTIRSHGELVFLIVSALTLIVVGFWMVIPVFGRPKPEVLRPGRPLRERFLAEARFLKKYGALESYLEVYIREIKLRLRMGDGDHVPESFLAERCGMDRRDIERAFFSGRGVSLREFMQRRKILETILESL
ncbi:MAG: DUF4350 domain-containing protein [Spirochaetales bacterium]|jgi:hypothetical protein|nr:DUF4350 domain-containing protein [Spirochaetales bacterium]